MSEKEKPDASFEASEGWAEGSRDAVNAVDERLANDGSVRTENLTLVNHHHNHYYGNPNANPEVNNQGNIFNTLVKIGLGITAVYAGAKLISSGGDDIKRLEEEKQKLLEMKEENEIKTLALHEEEKYDWYRYDNKTLLESNNTKSNKQYLFAIYDSKNIISLFNKDNPIYSKFGDNTITINNSSSNIIYKIFQERILENDSIKDYSIFFYIEEYIDKDGTYDSHFEREEKVKRAQYKVTHIDDEYIKLEYINIK